MVVYKDEGEQVEGLEGIPEVVGQHDYAHPQAGFDDVAVEQSVLEGRELRFASLYNPALVACNLLVTAVHYLLV